MQSLQSLSNNSNESHGKVIEKTLPGQSLECRGVLLWWIYVLFLLTGSEEMYNNDTKNTSPYGRNKNESAR